MPNTEGRCGMTAILDTENQIDLKQIAKAVNESLPKYAQPIFLRIVSTQMEMTGTYKLKKTKLAAEGFDLSKVNDKIYFLDQKAGEYIPLDQELYGAIMKGTKQF